MFSSGILDVAFGLFFLYLLLSLITSAVNELIEAWLKMRAVDLEKGIRELLQDQELVKKLYNHPLVFSLFQGDYISSQDPKKWLNRGDALPSYIPARNFALALLDIVQPASLEVHSGATNATSSQTAALPEATSPNTPALANAQTDLTPTQALRGTICKLPDEHVRQSLLTLVDAAAGDATQARKNIEAWFDSAMDRVSGWYKRRTQVILLLIGLLITIALNADTITIGSSLSLDATMRSALVAAAEEYAKVSTETPTDNPEERAKANLTQIRNLGLPIGWDGTDQRTMPNTPQGWLVKLVGWLLTAVAISLGAPFWFDVLNKFIVIRSTVKPHEKSPEEPAVDRAQEKSKL